MISVVAGKAVSAAGTALSAAGGTSKAERARRAEADNWMKNGGVSADPSAESAAAAKAADTAGPGRASKLASGLRARAAKLVGRVKKDAPATSSSGKDASSDDPNASFGGSSVLALPHSRWTTTGSVEMNM